MMTLMGRSFDVLRANVLDLVSKAEDPEKMLKLYLEQAHEHLRESQGAVYTALTTQKSLERQAQGFQEEMDMWTRRASLAVTNGKDDLATEALTEKRKAEASFRNLQPALTQATAQAKKAKEELDLLTEKVEEAQRNRDVLIARAQIAKAREHTAEAISKIGAPGSLDRLHDLEGKIASMEARADAASELIHTPGQEKESAFQELEHGSVESELTALKAKLGRA